MNSSNHQINSILKNRTNKRQPQKKIQMSNMINFGNNRKKGNKKSKAFPNKWLRINNANSMSNNFMNKHQ